MSGRKTHSPFEIFWLYCLLVLNTEVLKIQLNLVLLWAGAVVSVLLTSSLTVLPSFSIRYPGVGVRLKSSTGNNAKRAIEKPHNSCHSARAVCWAAPALFPWHLPLSCLTALPFAAFLPREGRCDVSHGSSWLLSGVRSWPELFHEAVTPWFRSRARGQAPSWSQSCLCAAPGTPCKGAFSILASPSRLTKQPRCEPRVPTEPNSCGSGGCLPSPHTLGEVALGLVSEQKAFHRCQTLVCSPDVWQSQWPSPVRPRGPSRGGSSKGNSGRGGGDSEKVLYRKGKGMLTAWGFVEQAGLYCCRFLSKNVLKLYGLRGLLTSALKIKLLWRRKKKSSDIQNFSILLSITLLNFGGKSFLS